MSFRGIQGVAEIVQQGSGSAKEALGRRWRAPLRRYAGLPLALLLFGCALQEADTPQTYDVSRASRLFSTGFQDVVDVYIEDLNVPELAFAGLDGLSSIDPNVSVAHDDRHLTLNIDGRRAGNFDRPAPQDLDAWGRLTADAIETVRHNSASLSKAESEAVYKAVFTGIISELDDFSRYSGREQARENRASRDGFGGIGVRIRIVDEGVKVLSVMEGTPAESAGLEAQDVITTIDGEAAAGMSQREVVRRLRGPVRTKVRVVVAREAESEPVKFVLTRAHIVPQTVRYRAEGDVAYIQVSGFNQNTSQTLRQKMLQARREQGDGLKGFVLDLRGNPGGLLDQAVSVSDLFMTRGRIVSTHGRHPDSHQFFEARSDDLAYGLPLAVLVNGNSASASEIVAAALQDSGRAVVIGTNSFGKGTVQTVLRLPNEGELTLTWARFHAPSGYALQQRGVLPNICTSGSDGTATALLEQVRQGRVLIDRATRSHNVEPRNEAALSALRARCPVAEGDQEIDLQVALAVVGDGKLYSQILRGAPETAERSSD